MVIVTDSKLSQCHTSQARYHHAGEEVNFQKRRVPPWQIEHQLQDAFNKGVLECR